jgi:hypothetical protein
MYGIVIVDAVGFDNESAERIAQLEGRVLELEAASGGYFVGGPQTVEGIPMVTPKAVAVPGMNGSLTRKLNSDLDAEFDVEFDDVDDIDIPAWMDEMLTDVDDKTFDAAVKALLKARQNKSKSKSKTKKTKKKANRKKARK